MQKKLDTTLTICFIVISCALYYFILTAGGALLTATSYAAIALCFLYALIQRKNKFILAGLTCTLAADFFLVVCNPIQQLWGMVFFLCAQGLYAAMLHRSRPSKALFIIRLIATAASAAITAIVLKNNTDALAVISICYYVNLIFNIIVAFTQFKCYPLFAIGLIFFLLCDTVIGLQVMADSYLPVSDGLRSLIFAPFNLAWLFYLPSQVLISLTSRKQHH